MVDDDVGKAFDVLDVECRPDIDAGVEQFLDILVAFGMAAVRRIGMRQFIDDDEFRPPGQRSIEIELHQRVAAIGDRLARQDFKALEQGGGLGPAMGFHDADDDILPSRLRRCAPRQHGIGLADARRRTEKYLQPAALLLLASSRSASGEGRVFAGGPFALRCALSIQREIEEQNINARLAEEAGDGPLNMGFDQLPQLSRRKAPRLGHSATWMSA